MSKYRLRRKRSGLLWGAEPRNIRSERKKQSETEKTESVPSEDGVIGVDFTGETEAVEEDLITEKDQGDMVKGVAEMFLHDHTFHAAIAATVGLAYLAYKLKYAPIDNWGQLCYRTNKLNYRSCELFSDGLVRLLRRCADGASCYVSKESDEAVKALSVVAGDINGIFNNVSSLRSESFGYTR